MNDSRCYLRGNVVLEPLFAHWYVWAHLLSPMTAASYVANQHLKIMQSFVAQPQIHVAAMKNPALIGGPYINYPASRVPDIKALLEKTTVAQAKLLEFAAALKTLDTFLNEHPKGMSLEELYPKVPEALRGYVELNYDLRNQPSVRLIEGLLYKSPYYDEAAQSILLWRMEQDDRSFIFSTPRLEENDNLHLPIRFRDPVIDELSNLRHRARPFGEIKEMLGVSTEKESVLRSMLTEDPAPPPPPTFHEDGMRIRYFGHACVLMESRGVSILTDPVVSYAYPSDLRRYTMDDLPQRIDYVIISHSHADHFMLETLLRIRSRIGTVIVPKSSGTLADPSLRLALRAVGFQSVIEIEELDEVDIGVGKIVGMPFLGEHGDLGVRSKLAYLVRMGAHSAVIAADSNALEPMLYSRIREVIGNIDLLFLGMESEGAPMSWSYGPMLLSPLVRKMDQSRRLNGSNCTRAMAITELLGPKCVYVYAMGQEPWLGHVMGLKYTETSPQIVESNLFMTQCQSRGIDAERPHCIKEVILQ